MHVSETLLTPELAKLLLSNVHPRQRKRSRTVVGEYARVIRMGGWKLVPDPICVSVEKQLFNGGHRCEAVIMANHAIPVMISWDADPDTFDYIDCNLRRTAAQFVSAANAQMRAAAARITLWYVRDFDSPLNTSRPRYSTHELLTENEDRDEAFGAMAKLAENVYKNTSIPPSIALAVFAIAYEYGYADEIGDFVDQVAHPERSYDGSGAAVLRARYRQGFRTARRREITEDWRMLVRALELHLAGQKITKLLLKDSDGPMPRVPDFHGSGRIHKALGRHIAPGLLTQH
jgi:hypothetical protein